MAKPLAKNRKLAKRPQSAKPRAGREGGRDRTAGRRQNKPEGNWIYGRHAGLAAICNPLRKIKRIMVTDSAATWLRGQGAPEINVIVASSGEIDVLLAPGAAHQGLALEAAPLPDLALEEACGPAERGRPVVILDQVTDPQNIGAVFRSAAAFGARAIIVQDRRTPPLAGALAKAAAGAVERVPCVQAVNIARSIEALRKLGYFCVGLGGDGETALSMAPKDMPLALVMGAEGAGLRPLVAARCDQLAHIAIAPEMQSLNVSAAAAIALYELSR